MSHKIIEAMEQPEGLRQKKPVGKTKIIFNTYQEKK